MQDINKMTDEEFDVWLTKDMKIHAKALAAEIENDPAFKGASGLSAAAYNNLMKRVMEMENASKLFSIFCLSL